MLWIFKLLFSFGFNLCLFEHLCCNKLPLLFVPMQGQTIAGVVVAKQMRKFPIILHQHTVHVHFPNFLIKLNPVSSLWELSNPSEPIFTTHTNGPWLSSLHCPCATWKWVLFFCFAPCVTYVTSQTPLIFQLFLSRHRFPHLSLTVLRILSFSFTEITSLKYLVTKTGWPPFFLSASSPSLWPLTVVSEAMPELDVEIYMAGEYLLLFFAKNLF